MFALLDRRVEGITIQMGDAEIVQLGMTHQPW